MVPRKPKTPRPSKRKDTTHRQVDKQMEDLCARLEKGTDEKGESLSPNQRAMLIRELRQIWQFNVDREAAAPVDEHKLATSEVYQATVKRLVAAVKDCDRCTGSVLKALRADV